MSILNSFKMKTHVLYILIFSFYIFVCAWAGVKPLRANEYYLAPGKIYGSVEHHGIQKLSTYCYRGVPKHILHMFQTVFMTVNLEQGDYDLYTGDSPAAVTEEYDHHRSSWSIQLFTWHSKTIKLHPFNSSCVGIDTSLDHNVIISIIRIDFWRIVSVVSGVVIFLSAGRLSSNPIFYYICGITMGVTTSFLILVYLLSRLMPFKRPTMYAFLLGGWTIGVYLFQMVWQNLRLIALTYQNHVLAYTLLSAFISFVVCYWFGPVTNPRTKNLIKWSLQGFALLVIFFSSHHQEASLGVILVLLSYYNFPSALTGFLWTSWKRRFPPKTRLLTEDEYHEQGARETIKALDEMRKYCGSPECNQWRTMLKLKQPIRFAEFMEGTSHLTDDELLEYEAASDKHSVLTDDSDDD